MVTITLAISSYAFASTYYVDASCGSSGDGTTAVCGAHGPWKTLAEAANGVPGGSNTISVAAGTYAGFTDTRNGPGSTAENDASYRIWKANGKVTITSQVTINGAWVKIDGFTISGAFVMGLTTNGSTRGSNDWFTNMKLVGMTNNCMTISGTNNRVTNSEFYNYTQDVFHVFGSGHIFRGNYMHDINPGYGNHCDIWQTWEGEDGAAQNILIESNHVFQGNTSTHKLAPENGQSDNLFMWENGGSRHASNLTIRNNIFESIGGLNSNSGNADGLKVYNNIFRNDYSLTHVYTGIGIMIHNASNVQVKNNMFIDGTNSIEDLGGNSSVSCDYNLLWRDDEGSTPNSYPGSHDKNNVNPLFTSYSKTYYGQTTGYKLRSNSPAIDAGTTIASVTNDYAGTLRPQGPGYDIGPYEFTVSLASAPSPPTDLHLVQ